MTPLGDPETEFDLDEAIDKAIDQRLKLEGELNYKGEAGVTVAKRWSNGWGLAAYAKSKLFGSNKNPEAGFKVTKE